MELNNAVKRRLAFKLQQSRLRLLERQPFYGLLLLYMRFSLDVAAGTAYTDGNRIAFEPAFLDSLSDRELDFVLMHEILHTALSHTVRGKEFKDQDAFNIATDIVVNSNILYSSGMDLSAIFLSETGESMHNLPDGREGYCFAAEEIYPVITELKAKGNINYQDLTSAGKAKSFGGKHLSGGESAASQEDRSGEPWDNHDKWEQKRAGDGPSDDGDSGKASGGGEKKAGDYGHSDEMRDLWLKRMVDATELINSMEVNIGSSGSGRGSVPAFMDRVLKELRKSRLDWRTILQNFIQEDIMDYSFMPPDRRFDDGQFFLPDFNEKEDSVRNVLFMVDTSGSMSDDDILDAFSEVKGAIDQFDGRLAGRLGFFDAAVYEPLPFEDVDQLLEIKPKGGGGTDFGVIFEYVRSRMDEPPVSIVILTDGYAPLPEEDAAQGIPVLWLINNEDVTPPWGRVARIKAE